MLQITSTVKELIRKIAALKAAPGVDFDDNRLVS
jgi:hypothetical protein